MSLDHQPNHSTKPNKMIRNLSSINLIPTERRIRLKEYPTISRKVINI